MKRQNLSLLFLTASALSLFGCDKAVKFTKELDITEIPYTAILKNDYFSPDAYNYALEVGKSSVIKVSTIPSLSSKDLVFESLNSSVASVDSNGRIRGVSRGKTQVEISTKDGSKKVVVNVFVRKAISNDEGSSIADKIAKNMAAIGEKTETVVSQKEIISEVIIDKDGSIPVSVEYIEELAFVDTEEDTYLYIGDEERMMSLPDGSHKVSDGGWRFYVDKESYVTYLIHETSSAKRYLELMTQSYMGRPSVEVLYDVMDMFFTAGREIVTDMVDEASGKAFLGPEGELTEYFKTAYDNLSMKSYTVGGKDDIIVDVVAEYLDTDETPHFNTGEEEIEGGGIAGLRYDQYVTETVYLEQDHTSGYDISVLEKVKDNEELQLSGYDRLFKKSVRFDNEYECYYPDLKNYAKVDTIYDL